MIFIIDLNRILSSNMKSMNWSLQVNGLGYCRQNVVATINSILLQSKNPLIIYYMFGLYPHEQSFRKYVLSTEKPNLSLDLMLFLSRKRSMHADLNINLKTTHVHVNTALPFDGLNRSISVNL